MELESFGGTIALRRPGEPRPELEREKRRRERDKEKDHAGFRIDVDVDIDAVVENPQSNPVAESQSKLLNFWEASLNSMRDGAQAVAQANTQALESWMELFRKGTQMASDRARAATERAARTATARA